MMAKKKSKISLKKIEADMKLGMSQSDALQKYGMDNYYRIHRLAIKYGTKKVRVPIAKSQPISASFELAGSGHKQSFKNLPPITLESDTDSDSEDSEDSEESKSEDFKLNENDMDHETENYDEVDLEELDTLLPEAFDMYFRGHNLQRVTPEEKAKLQMRSNNVIKKHAPRLILKYGAEVNLAVAIGKVLAPRVVEAQDIVKAREQRKAEDAAAKAAEAAKKAQEELKEKPVLRSAEGYEGDKLLELQKKYGLVK